MKLDRLKVLDSPLAGPSFEALVDGLGQELVGGRVGQEFAAAGEFDPRWYDWS